MSAVNAAFPTVKPTFERWLEDQLAERNMTREELATELGHIDKPKRISRLISGADEWNLDEIVNLAHTFGLHWWDDIVTVWGIGSKSITVDAAQSLLNAEGFELARICRAA